MATDLCLAVLKYSYAIGQNTDRTIPWTHLSASDMFLMLKGKDGKELRDEQLMLRIVHRNTVKESVDIATYVEDAISARAGAEQSGISPSVDQLPIFGMTKDVSLALRYVLPDGQLRRVQMRMESTSVCQEAVIVLRNRGLEFQEQRPKTGRPGSARPMTISSAIRPSSMLGAALPAQDQSYSNGQTNDAGLLERTFAMPRLIARDEVSAPRSVSAARPSTAQHYRSGPPTAHAPVDDSFHQVAPSPQRLSNGIGSYMQPKQNASGGIESARQMTTAMPPPTLISNLSNEHGLSSDTLSDGHKTFPSEANGSYQSHPFAPSTSLTQDSEVPPPARRDLLFMRPESRHSGSGAGSRPGSSALTLPPLPEPKIARDVPVSITRPSTAAPAKSARPVSPTRPATASPLKRVSAALEEERDVRQTQTESVHRPLSATRAEMISAQITASAAPARRYSRIDELLSRKPSGQYSNHTAPSRLNSLADAPGELVSPPQTAYRQSHVPTQSTQAKGKKGVNAAVSAIGAAMEASEEGTRAGYPEQDPADRQAALEAYILRKMEDPVFAALCQDVGASWRRITLGV